MNNIHRYLLLCVIMTFFILGCSRNIFFSEKYADNHIIWQSKTNSVSSKYHAVKTLVYRGMFLSDIENILGPFTAACRYHGLSVDSYKNSHLYSHTGVSYIFLDGRIDLLRQNNNSNIWILDKIYLITPNIKTDNTNDNFDLEILW